MMTMNDDDGDNGMIGR